MIFAERAIAGDTPILTDASTILQSAARLECCRCPLRPSGPHHRTQRTPGPGGPLASMGAEQHSPATCLHDKTCYRDVATFSSMVTPCRAATGRCTTTHCCARC